MIVNDIIVTFSVLYNRIELEPLRSQRSRSQRYDFEVTYYEGKYYNDCRFSHSVKKLGCHRQSQLSRERKLYFGLGGAD